MSDNNKSLFLHAVYYKYNEEKIRLTSYTIDKTHDRQLVQYINTTENDELLIIIIILLLYLKESTRRAHRVLNDVYITPPIIMYTDERCEGKKKRESPGR